MRKSKHCFSKGSGKRLTKAEYLRTKGKDREEEEEEPEPVSVPVFWPEPEEHSWRYDGMDVRVYGYTCDRCGSEPDHMFTQTLHDVDLTDKEQLEAIHDDHFKWVNAHFSCRAHLSDKFNDAFGGGGRLSNHYYRTHDDKWAHFKDAYFLTGIPSPSPMPEFTMNKRNYRKVLRAKSELLLGKRNFTFYYLPDCSQRKTGFCMVCEIEHWPGEYECPHADRFRYVDAEWDQHYRPDIPFKYMNQKLY